MRSKVRSVTLAVCLTACCPPAPLFADEKSPSPTQVAPELRDEAVTTRHQIVIAGRPVDYEATASRLMLRAADGQPRAALFSIAYVRKEKETRAVRPVMFCFQGGPGAPSAWVNLGGLGPRRVPLDAEGFADAAASGKLVDNGSSVLDATDLVFVDPVSTGFSRAAPGVEPKEFYGYRSDVESIGDFIALWMTRHGRWASPVYVAGESYGTIRAVGLAKYLQDRYAIFPRGLVLISAGLDWHALDWESSGLDGGNDLPYVASLPTYAAIAQYHKKLAPDLTSLSVDELAQAAERFATREYATALLQGERLPPAERAHIAAELARFTGLPVQFINSSDLRVSAQRFRKKLLQDSGRLLDTEDGRFTAEDLDPTGAESPERFPFSDLTDGSFIGLMNEHLREELGFVTDLPYAVTPEVWDVWNLSASPQQHSPAFMAGILRDAMARNQSLRVLIASGYFDMATPAFGTDLALDHARLPPTMRSRITVEHYGVGHYVYIKASVRAKLRTAILSLLGEGSG